MKGIITKLAVILLLAGSVIAASAQDEPAARKPGFFTPEEDRDGLRANSDLKDGLPHVLIIGDSISIGYTPPVVALLKGVANVQRVKANCGDTNAGIKNLKARWLGDTDWDVIHFNWGLHDLCYRNPDVRKQGNRDKVNGTQSILLEQYEKNLEALVLQLKETEATLIWASTTMVPEGEAGRVVGDDFKYNEVAAKVMNRHGIAINDLHALSKEFDGRHSRPGNVHYDKAGSEKLAQQVAEAIKQSLPKTRQETLPTLNDDDAPQTFEAMWGGYDPRAEPLDVEILKEWEEDGVVIKVLRYHIGVFKRQRAMMAAVYGYPKGGSDLPGLVQIHGGGQYAHSNAVLTNAKRGYATISISWAGRISAPGYNVSPREVKLFWEHKTDDPAYKLTTDWGALDAYHAPSKNGVDAFISIPTESWTLDAVESPRNNSWFLCTLGARRALTFLEQQPEVDGSKLGVYGHSMGGKLTVLTTAADHRVKAAAPSCGGISDRYNENALHRNTVGDATNLKQLTCPTIFLSPANDFHGHINDLPAATREIRSEHWRVICSAHANHQDLPESEVATQLWFDQHLKGTFTWPETPTTSLTLKTPSGVPSFSVTADASLPILELDVFYTQQGIEGGERKLRLNRINRFWHHAKAMKTGETWTASLPLFSTDQPLWVYANVVYALKEPVTGAGYYYGSYTTRRFNLSSLVQLVGPEHLHAAGVKATLKPELIMETFEGDWEKEWFTYKPDDWARKTHKLYHPRWAAPEGAKLSLEVLSSSANLLEVGLDGFAAEAKLAGEGTWQTITLSPSDFKNPDKKPISGWAGIMELRLGGKQWQGAAPDFRNLQWIKP